MSIGAILKLRCSRCLEGEVYLPGRWFAMHDACPRCGLKYEREPGFFLGAMYVSYTLGVLIALPVSATLFFKYDVGAGLSAFAGSILTAVATPWIVRISRVAWLHFDQRLDPR